MRNHRIDLGKLPFLLTAGLGILIGIIFYYLAVIQFLGVSFQQRIVGRLFGEGFTIDNYKLILLDDFYLRVLLITVLIALSVSLLCAIFGYPIAYFLATRSGKLRQIILLMVVASLFTNITVRSFGWIVMFAETGFVNTFLASVGVEPISILYTPLAVAIGMVQINLPVLILVLAAVVVRINPELRYASQSLGANKLTTFCRITFPLSVPGLVTGIILVFVLTIGTYITVELLGGGQVRTLPIIIYNLITRRFNWQLASAAAVVLLTAAIFCISLIRLLGKQRHKQEG